MASPNDEIVKGIDGIYSNKNPNSNIRYVINESRFNASQLCKMKKGIKQMSDEWLLEDGGKRILKAVNGDRRLKDDIIEALNNGAVEKVYHELARMEK